MKTAFKIFSNSHKKRLFLIWLALIFIGIFPAIAFAQTTEFTYQGKLTNTGTQSATYDFEFRLCTSETNCAAPLGTVQRTSVPVTGGSFSVKLDFGSAVFDGSDRWLEIGVKLPAETSFTTLLPRSKITSAPYAIQSLKAATAANSEQLGGTAASQYVQITDPRLNANNYVQNTNTPQPSADFNIGGTGTANVLNAATQFNLNNQRILSNAGTRNLFAGVGAGTQNSAADNAFFGFAAGLGNTTGSNNAFFGSNTGRLNQTGFLNSFFGGGAGNSNTTGSLNSFFGGGAGLNNTTGLQNSFFGEQAGNANFTASGNSFFGASAGNGVAPGNNNTLVGANTNLASGGIINSAAVGANAYVSQSNSIVLGSISGVNSATATTNVGIGTTAPSARLHVRVNSANLLQGDAGCGPSFFGIGFAGSLNCTNYSILGDGSTTFINRATGGSLLFREANVDQLVIRPGGNVGIGTTLPTSKLEIAAQDALTMRGYEPFLTFKDSNASDEIAKIQSVSGSLHFSTSNVIGAVPAMSITKTNLSFARIGINKSDPLFPLDVLGVGRFSGVVYQQFANGGTTSVCKVSGDNTFLHHCSSSLRYKTNIQPFSGSLDVINRLKPVTFDWKSDGTPDLGFVAEEVSAIEPLLVTQNSKGEVEGVKYDRLSVLFVNAFKEQQAQIKQLREQLDALKKLLCQSKAQADVCKKQEEEK